MLWDLDDFSIHFHGLFFKVRDGTGSPLHLILQAAPFFVSLYSNTNAFEDRVRTSMLFFETCTPSSIHLRLISYLRLTNLSAISSLSLLILRGRD